MNNGKRELEKNKNECYKTINSKEKELENAKAEYISGLEAYREGESRLEASEKELQALYEKILYLESVGQTESAEQLRAVYDDNYSKLEAGKSELEKNLKILNSAEEEIRKGESSLDVAKRTAQAEFVKAQADIDAGAVKLEDAKRDLNSAKQEI